MTVLVIGQRGQVASSLADLQQSRDIRIVTMGRPAIDLLQPATVTGALETLKPDIVVNTAAYTAVDKAESERELAFAINADGPAHLGAACAARGIPIIHLSTDYVYDGKKASPYIETDAVRPLSVYGASKLAGEQRLASANPTHIILRTAWVHSPFGQNFVKTMLRLGATRSHINVVADQLGNPTYASHLAEAILAIASRIIDAPAGDTRWGVYHVVNKGDTTWFGLAEEVFRRASGYYGYPNPVLQPIPTVEFPTPAERPANSRLDTSKLQQTFGLAMASWHEGVADCLQLLAGRTGGTLAWWRERQLESSVPRRHAQKPRDLRTHTD